jgi:hypothetical protein
VPSALDLALEAKNSELKKTHDLILEVSIDFFLIPTNKTGEPENPRRLFNLD